MKPDHTSYRRAASMSLLGLAIQLALGLTFSLYGIFVANPAAGVPMDHAAISAGVLILLGVPVWLTLAILFDQHRRERLEAMESEAMAASDGGSGSVFERHADDLRVQERRLRFFHRWVVPAVSLGLGAALIAAGVWRYRSGLPQFEAETFRAIEERGWPMGVGLASAFLAFVFARYVAVMGRQKVWGPLRAGAGYAVAAAASGLALAVGHLVDIAGPSSILRYLVPAIPALMVLLGAEIFLNFVLDIYRPRKPGEFPRPAFESRLLGFVASPDRIAESIGEALNYQVGYDVASSWFYRLLSRVLLRLLLPVALIVLWAMSSLAVIRPHQKGIVLRWGAFSRVVEPGLNLKWPWPIETVEIPEYVTRDPKGDVTFRTNTVTGVRTLQIGSIPREGTDAILWTNDHATEEVFFLVQPAAGGITGIATPGGAGGSPGSFGLAQMAVEFPLHYAVDDVEAYERLGPPGMRDELIRAVAQRELKARLSSLSVSELLGGSRAELSADIRRRIDAALIRINPKGDGKPVVRVISAGIGGMHPPKDAATAFEGVVVAEQKYNSRVKTAEATAIQTLSRAAGSVELARQLVAALDEYQNLPAGVNAASTPARQEMRVRLREMMNRAGGAVAASLASASADRWDRHMGERARLLAFEGLLGTYRASPALFRANLYFDTLLASLQDARLFITPEGLNLEVQFDGQDKDSVQTIFDTQNTNQ